MTLRNMQTRKISSALAVTAVMVLQLVTLSQVTIIHGFLVPTSTCTSAALGRSSRRQHSNTLFMSVAEEEDTEVAGVEDKNGTPFRVGSVVRVSVENRMAYQVQAQFHGSFNEDKEFVPAPEGGGPATKNLVLPVGMRGVVTKVYDNEKISANFPIQVKFVPGENTDEGFDPPVSFVMHFETYEVECV